MFTSSFQDTKITRPVIHALGILQLRLTFQIGSKLYFKASISLAASKSILVRPEAL